MKFSQVAISITPLLIAMAHHAAFGQSVDQFQFKAVDPCDAKGKSVAPETYVACKISNAAEVPLIVSATCGKIASPQIAKLKLKIEVFGDGIVKSAEIVETNVSDPWFAWRVTHAAYSLKLPSIKNYSAFNDMQIELDPKEISSRVRIYNCKDLYVGGGR